MNWIKVEDRKPINGQHILTAYKHIYDNGASWIVQMMTYWDGFNCSESSKKYEIKDVTHWAEVEPPQED